MLTSRRGYRRAMAKSMTAANEVPHFTFCEEIDMDRLVALRGRLQAAAAAAAPGGADVVKVTYMPLIMKALSAALREFPEVNATVNSDATELSCRGGLVGNHAGFRQGSVQGLATTRRGGAKPPFFIGVQPARPNLARIWVPLNEFEATGEFYRPLSPFGKSFLGVCGARVRSLLPSSTPVLFLECKLSRLGKGSQNLSNNIRF